MRQKRLHKMFAVTTFLHPVCFKYPETMTIILHTYTILTFIIVDTIFNRFLELANSFSDRQTTFIFLFQPGVCGYTFNRE